VARKKGKELDSRAALLDAAWALLLERGAEGMSVDAIVGRARLSKGTFFHFFPAKRDLLDALCARIAEESWSRAGRVLDRSRLDPVARLDLFLRTFRSWRSARAPAVGGLWRELARPENAALMAETRSVGIDRLAPALARLVAEGTARRRMRVDDPEVAARLIVEWMYASVEGSLRLVAVRRDAAAVDLVLRRANATLAAIERVLGIRRPALRRVRRRDVATIAAGLDGDGGSEPGGKG
jgi:AcrR family transcriptional regulator